MTTRNKKGVTIVIVDDDQDINNLLSTFFRSKNYRVLTAFNAHEAINILEVEIPDLIISDILMPDMDGFEFRNYVWQDPDLQFVPFIFLTAVKNVEFSLKSYELFADDYLTKPFDFGELHARVKSRLRKYQILQERVQLDSLTQVFSRRFVMSLLSREMERSRRFNRDMSVIMIDIDNFKRINDTYGHIAGDVVLHEVSKELSSLMRDYDFVGRFGGEEFLVVLPETGKEKALEVAERVRETIARQKITEHNIALTFSGGIATFPLDGGSVKEIILKADKALYLAKGLGKNKIVKFD